MAHHTATNLQMKVSIAQAIDNAPIATLHDVRARLRGELTCGVCRELLCEPVAFDCAHMFCASCANALTPRNGGFLACPLCRKNVAAAAPAQTIGAVLVVVFGEEYAQELRERAKNELVLAELEKLRAEAVAEARSAELAARPAPTAEQLEIGVRRVTLASDDDSEPTPVIQARSAPPMRDDDGEYAPPSLVLARWLTWVFAVEHFMSMFIPLWRANPHRFGPFYKRMVVCATIHLVASLFILIVSYMALGAIGLMAFRVLSQ